MTLAQEIDLSSRKYELSHLRSLEAEAIHIIREAVSYTHLTLPTNREV